MSWRNITKNSPPATCSQLEARSRELIEESRALSAEVEEINAALPSLTGQQYHAAANRLSEIHALRVVHSDTQRLLSLEHEKAQQREQFDALLTERAELERKSNRLAKSLPDRYQKAAEALAVILREIEEDEDAWEALNFKLHQAGELGRPSAQRRAREATETVAKVSQWGANRSLTSDSCILGWNVDGEELFRGRGVALK